MAFKVAFSSLLFLLLLITLAAIAASEAQCTYVISVQTGDRKKAGTDSKISLYVKDVRGTDFKLNNLEDWGIMGTSHDYFEQGHLDLFKGQQVCLHPCYITVTSDGSGGSPGWYLDYVKIAVNGPTISTTVDFLVNRWLAKDEKPYTLYATVDYCHGKLLRMPSAQDS
ncbi:PLAT domain-containing protein 1-like [Prosopis cineraria]|uniref:PLAT domain-containing protein 1-like n=1 Tax=Prosopis cineraria TaxID=364024 RepID=UPI0024108BAB|nr:PLAT domain-containing protein 1-like [Prosopis cineraria]